MQDDELDHATLGRFAYDFGDEAWVGRWAAGDLACNLIVLSPEGDEVAPPPVSALERLTVATGELTRLVAHAIDSIRKARAARLAWAAEPADAAWTLDGLVIDQGGQLWLVLHEFETDAYSDWWSAVDRTEVRRGAVGASYDPKSARPV